jgi:hypothetical protein
MALWLDFGLAETALSSCLAMMQSEMFFYVKSLMEDLMDSSSVCVLLGSDWVMQESSS